MADLVTNIDLIQQSQSQKEVTANALFDATSPATIFGRHASACAGLTWGYYGGKFNIAGTPTAILNGTLALTASSTCYIRVATTTGVVSFVTSAPSGWPGPVSGYTALYELTTGAATVTDGVDWRQGVGTAGPAGTGYGGTSATSFAVGTGSKAFTTQAGMAYQIGARVRAISSANTANYMEGLITAYSGTTLTISVDTTGGSGTHTDWLFNMAGNVGNTGATGANWSVTVNPQTGTTYTLVAGDNGVVVTLSNASAITVTVPSGLGANFACELIQIGAGQVTVAASGVTLNSYGGLVKLIGQHAAATLVAYVSNVFNLSGNLSA